MLYKMFKALQNHIIAVVRIFFVLLIPCAFSKHFAYIMVVVSVLLNLLLLCGKTHGWDEPPAKIEK